MTTAAEKARPGTKRCARNAWDAWHLG